MTMMKLTLKLRVGQNSGWMSDYSESENLQLKPALRTCIKDTFSVCVAEHTGWYDVDALGNPSDGTVTEFVQAQLSVADDGASNNYFIGNKIIGCCHWEGDQWRKCEEYAVKVGTSESTSADAGIHLTTEELAEEFDQWVPLRAMVSWHCHIEPASGLVDAEVGQLP